MPELVVLEPKKEPLHPVFYEVYQPNALIGVKGKADFKLTEFRVYNEILAQNHVNEPTRLVYDVPIKLVTKNKNFKSIAADIRQSLGGRSLLLNKEIITHLNKRRPEGKKITSDNRIVHPFAKIDLSEKSDVFTITLDDDFKEVLLMIKTEEGKIRDYSRGDINTLREFNHNVSNLLYWEIRRRQVFRQTWKTTFDQMREDLGFGDKYENNYKEFRRKVLEPAKEELATTWCAFEYEAVPGTKRGRKVTNINVFFKNGPDEERNSPLGKDEVNYPWEQKMIEVGVKPSQLKLIRNNIENRLEGLDPSGNRISWCYDYVEISLKHARIQWLNQKKSGNPVKLDAAWLIDGLLQGYWNRYVEEELSTVKKAVQTTLFPEASLTVQ